MTRQTQPCGRPNCTLCYPAAAQQPVSEQGGPEPETPVLDGLITVVRVPVAAAASAAILVGGWPLEFVVGLVAIVWGAMVDSRPNMRREFGNWPFEVFSVLNRVWRWAFND